MECIFAINYFTSGKDKQPFLFSLILWPCSPGRGWHQMQDGNVLEAPRKPFLPGLSFAIFPVTEKVPVRCFQWCPCCQTSGQHPVFPTPPLSPTVPGTVVYFEMLLPLAFGRQQRPASSSILLTCFFTGSLPPSEGWRNQTLARFLSSGSFPCLSFLLPCVSGPFSICVHSRVMMLA